MFWGTQSGSPQARGRVELGDGCCGPVGLRTMMGAFLEETGRTRWRQELLTPAGCQALWPKAAETPAGGTPGGKGLCPPAASSAHPSPEVDTFLGTIEPLLGTIRCRQEGKGDGEQEGRFLCPAGSHPRQGGREPAPQGGVLCLLTLGTALMLAQVPWPGGPRSHSQRAWREADGAGSRLPSFAEQAGALCTLRQGRPQGGCIPARLSWNLEMD